MSIPVIESDETEYVTAYRQLRQLREEFRLARVALLLEIHYLACKRGQSRGEEDRFESQYGELRLRQQGQQYLESGLMKSDRFDTESTKMQALVEAEDRFKRIENALWAEVLNIDEVDFELIWSASVNVSQALHTAAMTLGNRAENNIKDDDAKDGLASAKLAIRNAADAADNAMERLGEIRVGMPPREPDQFTIKCAEIDWTARVTAAQAVLEQVKRVASIAEGDLAVEAARLRRMLLDMSSLRTSTTP